MILEELILHNFGIYKGRHSISLSPQSPNKPIVLIGALNGGGKTTLLDALKLALFGKFANCSNKGNLSYSEFLLNSINNQVSEREGASVELQFRYWRQGEEHTVRINRTWRLVGKSLREDSEVLENGKFVRSMTDRWYEFIENFVPLRVSNLFLFDGEKIESLANSDDLSELIHTGLHALLGLDLVDQACRDLRTLDQTRYKSLARPKENSDLLLLQEQVSNLDELNSKLVQEIASERTKLQIVENRIKKLEDEFRREGGELFDNYENIESEYRFTANQVAEAETTLRELAASSAAPILLVQNLLQCAKKQAINEEKIQLLKSLSTSLVERDDWVLDFVKNKSLDNQLISELESLFAADQKRRRMQAIGDIYLNISPESFQSLNCEILRELAKNISNQVNGLRALKDKLSYLRDVLAAVPDRASLAKLNASLSMARDEKQGIELKIAELDQDLEIQNKRKELADTKYRRVLEEFLEQKTTEEAKKRVFQHSQKLQGTLLEFRCRVANQHIQKLEKLILESFNQMVRKPELIEHVKISPETYEISLYTRSKNTSISPERLSAGERQLLTVSILWGLAKASGRLLPAVIDTPLSRLDSKHRHKLVNNYFPFASHQVILLSTDEEITRQYHENLGPYIAREYQIEYNPESSSSQINSGYF